MRTSDSMLCCEHFGKFIKCPPSAKTARLLQSHAFRKELVRMAKQSFACLKIRVNGEVRAEGQHENSDLPAENPLKRRDGVKHNGTVMRRRKINSGKRIA